MKTILVAGPSQSGSTLLFNMLRIILEKAGHSVDSCWHQHYTDGKFDKSAEYLIVKCHFYDHALWEASDMVFLPMRDFRDSAVSCNRRYGSLNTPDDYLSFVLQNIDQFESWRPRARYVFKYEKYVAHKQSAVAEAAARLGVFDARVNEVIAELDALHSAKSCPQTDILPKDEYAALMENKNYRKTLMTASHNTSGGAVGRHATEIPKNTLLYIESDPKVRSFLTEHGYRLTQR